MIGMYIYAISIGMDFRTVSELLMSETGLMITETMQGNSLQRVRGMSKAEKAFEYFKKGPINRLYQYDRNLDSPSTNASPLKLFQFLLEEDENYSYAVSNLPKSIRNSQHFLITLAQMDNNYALKFIKNVREKVASGYGEKDKVQWHRMLDFIEEYIIQYSHLNLETLNKLQWLSQGAEEMRVFGQIAGLNQGLKTSQKDILNFLEVFEGLLVIEDSNGNKSKPITIQDIVYANEEQRKEYIKLYENNKKHTFNLIHAIYSVPHIFEYIKMAAIQDLANQNASYSYRNIRKHMNFLKGKYELYSSDDVVRGFSRYLDNKNMTNWLSQLDSATGEFTVPSNSQVFDPFGEMLDPLTQPLTLKLGDVISNASFKLWMEETVIPDLKAGKLNNPNINGINVQGNLFIRGLIKKTNTKTVSKNSTDIYTLGTNLMPRSEEDYDRLKTYQEAFNSLSGESYWDGGGKEHNIKDLLTLYILISTEGRTGEKSLMSLLKNQEENFILNSYNKYITKLDLSEGPIEDIDNLNEELMFYMTSKKGKYGYSLYAYEYDDYSGKYRLMIKNGYQYGHKYSPKSPEYLINPQVLPIVAATYELPGTTNKENVVKILQLDANITAKNNRFIIEGIFEGNSFRKEMKLNETQLAELIEMDAEGNWKWSESKLRYKIKEYINPTPKC